MTKKMNQRNAVPVRRLLSRYSIAEVLYEMRDICGQASGGFTCTLEIDHTMDHDAQDVDGNSCKKWARF